MSAEPRIYEVDLLTRVEGEGSFYLRVRGGTVEEARLAIFEAPRFFEAFLRGRSLFEVPDLVARICGICPVAYQMSALAAIEGALGVAPTEPIRKLRRLMYCGEWIESHALHVFLLHAPDFLGYPGAIEMARDHPDVVERGLALKKAGNALIALLGGRAIHPVSPRVGGFSKVPRAPELRAIRESLQRGLDEAREAVRWAASLPVPDFEQDYVFVALASGEDYPLESGDRIVVSGRADVPVAAWDAHFVEQQVPHSSALQCRLRDGTLYLCGPLARLNHHADRLHPVAAQALREHGPSLPVQNPYRSIVVRTIEIVHAFAEALDLIDGYVEPDRPFVEITPRAATGAGATEAPRGLLWHRYALGEDGLVAEARIVPPTSQNQARIEQDLAAMATELLALSHEAATQRCEQLIRAHDPCISCATHFLKLALERAGEEA
jgi:coenzyme F420-reducing hydrogenase alpha subunit